MGLRLPRRVEGRVRDMAGADGALETEHGIVFVPLAVPGDLVRVEAIRKRGKVLRGRLAEVLEPSPSRRDAPCPIVARCGGCPWMPIHEDRQSELKRRRLERFGVEVDWFDAQQLGYRRRARLAWHVGGSVALGYRERAGKRVVDAADCLVLERSSSTAWAALRTLGDVLAGQGEVLIGPADQGAVALLRTKVAQPPALYERCPELIGPALRGIVLDVDGARAEWGETWESYPVDGSLLRSALGGFAQGHGALNEALVQYVGERVGADNAVLELFCGAGNLSVRLAREAASWVGVELDAAAVEACRGNLKRRGLEGRVVEANAESFPAGRYDVVVLDPPRTGARDAVRRMRDTRATRIVYVSCHVATLERDVNILGEQGYRMESCAGFDMFPQTEHLEVVATMVPK